VSRITSMPRNRRSEIYLFIFKIHYITKRRVTVKLKSKRGWFPTTNPNERDIAKSEKEEEREMG
jgi:hypothetical protein